MTMAKLETTYLIKLLCSVIHNEDPEEPPRGLDWDKLYNISMFHDVSNMVFYGVDKLSHGNKPHESVVEKFQKDRNKSLVIEATQHIVVEQVLKVFRDNSIDCMPLKGHLIKHLYPKPNMRSMGDIDILVKDDQIEDVKSLMFAMGFVLEIEGENHDLYCKKPFINIEIHRRLIPLKYGHGVYFSKVWDRALLKDGCKSIYELSMEDTYIYLIAHLAKHYYNGGIGIRSIMDIYLYNLHYKNMMDNDYIRQQLNKINFWEFTKNIVGLSESWFGNEPTNELYDEMGEYIFSSGVSGTVKHQVASNMDKKLSYWLELFFPGIDHMKILYPFLNRFAFLLPLSWFLRAIKCLVFKNRHMFGMINNVGSVSKEDASKVQDLHKRTGFVK